MMRGKWAAGIPPRHLTWILPERLAASERPGGRTMTHRKVRRQEEIIWLRENNFSVVVSILESPLNLAAYEEFNMPASHQPIPLSGDQSVALVSLYAELAKRQQEKEMVLLHGDDLGDHVIGVIAGYLMWAGRLHGTPEATSVVERLFGRQLGPEGRALVATAERIPPARS